MPTADSFLGKMDADGARQNAREMARRLHEENPHARYELDWTSPLQLLVATILSGGSKDSSVNEVTPALFGRWPDAQALAAADLAQLADVLRPLGLAQQKAARLVAVCEQLVQRFAGRVPGSMAEMLTLPGVQRKTANVVLTNVAAKSASDKPADVSAAGFPADWAAVLEDDLKRLDFEGLMQRVAEQRRAATVFPPPDEVFSAFHCTAFEATQVIILGQDPYHGAGQGHGLAFSVKPGVKVPPSLVNMYKELRDDVGCTIASSGCLVPWAKQGVLLLNTVLTVRSAEPNSHKGLGWEELTDAVIRALNARAPHLVVVLWGNHARKKARLIAARHTIIEGAHPSPLSVKQFSGSRPFSKVNLALRSHGQREIDWQIPD